MCKLRGIGVDLCGIERMAQQLHNQSFLNRCFTPAEQQYIQSRGKAAADTMAGLWAAKEAALKALGTGIALPMTDVEITRSPSGQPAYQLHGKALELADNGTLLLSISHENDMAIAFCTWSSSI